MIFRVACGDVMPGCTARFESLSQDQLLRQVSVHASTDHGLPRLSPDVLAVISAKITTDPVSPASSS